MASNEHSYPGSPLRGRLWKKLLSPDEKLVEVPDFPSPSSIFRSWAPAEDGRQGRGECLSGKGTEGVLPGTIAKFLRRVKDGEKTE